MPVYDAATLGLKIDSKEFNKEMGATGTRAEKVLGSMALQAKAFDDRWHEITKGIKDTKRIIGGILVSRAFYGIMQGATGAASAVLQFSKNMETAKISLEYFTDAAAGTNLAMNKVTAYLNTVNTFAAKTPFTTEQVLSLSKYMQAVGVSMNATQSFLRVITDTAAATGATEENLQRVVFGLGQMLTKGRLANEEIRQLANANIPIYEILQEELKLTGTQISNIGTQWVAADKAVVAILNGLEKRYKGSADRIADTMTGMTDTIIDNSKIIATEAFSSLYKSLGSFTAGVRDKLDEMREVVTEEGAGGLFNKVLLDIDPSGAVGASILRFIGNVVNLKEALSDLYMSAQPILKIMGSAFTGTINFAVISLTGMVQVLDDVVKFLNFLGLTTGDTAQVIATLVIAYKSAHWLSFMGEAAVKAAYGLYQTAVSASAILPASIRARTGLSLLAVGLSGIIALGLTAVGVFSALNGAFSGMSDTDMFSGEYADKFAAYEKQMKDYYAEIEKYQKDYEAGYETISDGATTATTNIEDTTEATKAGTKAANKWLAAFDEVYDIPDPSGGGSTKAPVMPDFGALLEGISFKFPTVDVAAITKPTLELTDMFRDGIMNNDVLDAGWWTSLLPALFLGGAVSLSKILAKRRKDAADAAKGEGGGGTSGAPNSFQSTKEALAALKNLTESFRLQEKSIKDLLDEIKQGKFNTEAEQKGAYNLLNQRLAASEKLLDKINSQLIIAGKFDTEVTSDILKEARNLSDIRAISENVQRLTTLTIDAKDTGFTGEAARKEIAEIKKLLEKQYATYIGRTGSSVPELDALLKGIINTEGLEGRVATLIANVKEIKKQLETAGYDTKGLENKIEDTNKLGNSILNELDSIGVDITAIEEPVKLIKDINKLQQLQTKRLEGLSKLDMLNELVKNSDAIGLSVGKVLEVTEEIDSVKTTLQTLERKINVQIELLKVGTAEQRASIAMQQAQLEANRTFMSAIDGTIKNNLTAMLKPLKAIDTYTNKIMTEQLEGQKVLKAGISKITDVLGKLPAATSTAIKPVLEQLRGAYQGVVDTGKIPNGFVGSTITDFTERIIELGESLGADTGLVLTAANRIYKSIKNIDGHTNELEFVTKQLAAERKAARTGSESPSTAFLTIVSEKLDVLEETAKTLKEFDTGITAIRKQLTETFPNEYAFYQKQLTDIVVTSREYVGEKLEKLANLQKVANSRLYKIASNSPALELLNDMNKSLTALTEWQVGSGTRRGVAWPQEPTSGSYANAIHAGYISADIVKANLFSPYRLALSGGDMAGTFGQSDYGKTVWTALIDNMTESARALAGIPKNLNTIRAIANMTNGKVGEVVVLVEATKKLAEKGINIAKGDIFLDEMRKLQAQLDAIAFNTKGKLLAPLDAKVVASFEKTFKPILENVATFTNGIYKINAKGFKTLLSTNEDIAWQLATQSKILGTTKAYLAVLDSKGAGIPSLDISGLMQFSPSIASHVSKIEKLLAKQAAENYVKYLNNISNNLYLIEVTIPKWTHEIIDSQAEQFSKLQSTISKLYLTGTPLSELITPINMLGEAIGKLSTERYTGSISLPSGTGDTALNAILRDINTQLQAHSPAIVQLGKLNLQELLERLEAATYNNTSSIMPRLIELGFTSTGTKAIAQLTGDRLIQVIDQIKAFQNSFEGYAATAVTQLSDLVAQMNKAAEAQLTLADAINGKNIQDLAWSIIKSAEKVPGGDSVAKQVQSMLSGGAAMPITNTAGFADLGVLLTKLAATEQGKQIQQGLTTTGTSSNMFIPAYMLDMFVSTLDFTDMYNELVNSMSVEGKLGTEEALNAFNSKYAGTELVAPGSVSSNVFGTNYSLSTDALEMFPEEFRTQVIEPLERLVDIKNANISPFVSDLLFGGLFKSIGDAFVEDMSVAKQTTAVGGQYLKDSEVLYNYGLASPAERAVRAMLDAQNPGQYAPVTAQTAVSYAPKLAAMPWSNSGEFFDWILDFYKENETATEKVAALNKIAEDRYSKEYEYLTYLTQYATGNQKEIADMTMMPYIKESNLYEQLGLAELDSLEPIVKNLQTYLTDLPALTIQTVDQYKAIIQQLVDNTEASVLPTLQAQQEYNTGAIPGLEDYSRVIAGDFSNISADAAKQFSDILGITFTSISEGLGTINIDAERIKNNITGWVAEIPDTISLDSLSISTSDAQILASAGIQINSDGTITFMKALNADQSGTERALELVLSDVAPAVQQKLEEAGLTIDFGGEEGTALNLSIDTLSNNMQSALFKLSDDLSGEVSDSMRAALAGLGEITASGYFRITNPDVLSGKVSITEYIKSLGKDIDNLSPEVKTALEKIDSVIQSSQKTILTEIGQYGKGNIDLFHRQLVDMGNGYKATVESMSFETDGVEVLIPTIINGKKVTDKEAIEHYFSTGEFLGKFASVADANAYAQKLHQAQAIYYGLADEISATYKVTAEQIANAADGIIIESPLKPEELTDEMILAFGQIGVTFTEENGKLMMLINRAGQQLKDGVTVIPTELWNQVDKDVRIALHQIGVSTSKVAGGVMVDISEVMSNGAADIVRVFAERPDLWNKIPQTLIDTLAASGISVVDGMIQINTDLLDGLVNVQNQWYGHWSNIPDEVIEAMGASKLATSEGLMRLEQITADTVIPDNVNEYIRKPFSELPDEIKDMLTGGDASVVKALQDAEFLITPATEDAFVGSIQAVHDSFASMNTEATDGAQQLATTIANALMQVKQLDNLQANAGSTGLFGLGGKNTVSPTGEYKKSTGYTYYKRYNASGNFLDYVYYDKKGTMRATSSIPEYASGGLITTDGLYRAGEFGRNEAIIPLENASALNIIGKTIVSYMPSSLLDALRPAAGLANGGIHTPASNKATVLQSVDTLTKGMLERLLPAMMNTTEDRPILYVDTLIADEAGLRLLEKKMHTIRQTEDRRKR